MYTQHDFRPSWQCPTFKPKCPAVRNLPHTGLWRERVDAKCQAGLGPLLIAGFLGPFFYRSVFAHTKSCKSMFFFLKKTTSKQILSWKVYCTYHWDVMFRPLVTRYSFHVSLAGDERLRFLAFLGGGTSQWKFAGWFLRFVTGKLMTCNFAWLA